MRIIYFLSCFPQSSMNASYILHSLKSENRRKAEMVKLLVEKLFLSPAIQQSVHTDPLDPSTHT